MSIGLAKVFLKRFSFPPGVFSETGQFVTVIKPFFTNNFVLLNEHLVKLGFSSYNSLQLSHRTPVILVVIILIVVILTVVIFAVISRLFLHAFRYEIVVELAKIIFINFAYGLYGRITENIVCQRGSPNDEHFCVGVTMEIFERHTP